MLCLYRKEITRLNSGKAAQEYGEVPREAVDDVSVNTEELCHFQMSSDPTAGIFFLIAGHTCLDMAR